MTETPRLQLLEPTRYALEVGAAMLERTSIAPEQVGKMLSADVGHSESEIVYEENKVELHRYTPDEVKHDTPIVLVYALINRPYILDLQPNFSVIRTLLDAGFEVYLVDWGEPSRLDTNLRLEDYICRYLDNCVDEVCDRCGVDEVHFLGYCMGGTLSVMYTALYPERVRTLGTMALAFSFDGESGLFETWADHVDADTVTETYGNAPKRPMTAVFTMKEPVETHVRRYADLYDRFDDDAFVEMFSRIEQWSWDGVDIARETFRQFIQDIYQENRLAENDLYIGGRHVDLDAIEIPVLQVIGEEDTIAPPACSKPLEETISSRDYTEFEFATGHFGVSISPSAHTDLWPDVAAWYGERSQDPDGKTSEMEFDNSGNNQSSSVQTVNGIGPTYAERLSQSDIETTAELASHDPATLADIAETSVSRAEGWLEQAR